MCSTGCVFALSCMHKQAHCTDTAPHCTLYISCAAAPPESPTFRRPGFRHRPRSCDSADRCDSAAAKTDATAHITAQRHGNPWLSFVVFQRATVSCFCTHLHRQHFHPLHTTPTQRFLHDWLTFRHKSRQKVKHKVCRLLGKYSRSQPSARLQMRHARMVSKCSSKS